jgi:insertion element IS1 protein InsB
MKRDTCPNCGSGRHKKNGHIHNGKQNYRCLDCGRQFVADYAFKTVTEETKELIKKALLERNALRGICRIFDVSLTWLLAFVAELYAVLPADLGIDLQSVGDSDAVSLYTMAVEADEMWSFVAKKSNKQWIWIALDAKTRQVIAFHVGDRSKESARQLWGKIPDVYRQHATFYTDLYDSYVDVIPEEQPAILIMELTVNQ